MNVETPTGWHNGPLAAWDLETTGIDVDEARVVTASCWLITPGQGKQHREWLVDPGIDIPEQATQVHGITTAKAKAEGQPAVEAVSEIASAVLYAHHQQIPVIAYNARYDTTLLHRELVRHGHADLARAWEEFAARGPIVDPFILDKQIDRYRKGSRKLIDVADHYGVPLSEEDAHGSAADALAAARVAWVIANRNPKLAALGPVELHEAQVKAAAEQAHSFADYLRKQGKPADDVRPEWPLIPA